MNAGTSIKPRLQGRQGATVLHWPLVAMDVPPHVSRHHEIFKKTPFVSGLHSVGRDAVKDIPEIASIPLLTTTLLDQDAPHGIAVAGRQIAENPTAVTRHSHQDVLRSADERTAAGDVVGVKGNQAIDLPFTGMALAAGDSNGNLTDRGWDARTSRWAACATNARVGDVSFTKQDRFVIAGASRSGGDLENHSYADI
jgi:hypothetical protein